MKVIDLYNKIANGEEAPKKIKLRAFELKRTQSSDVHRLYVDDNGMFFPKDYSFYLNEEIEILEEEKKFTKEDFIKEAMDLEDITREEFNKRYEVKECNCGREYCKGFIKVEKVQEEKKIPENLPFKNDMKLTIMEVYHELEKYNYKINEIIDYLKSKGE